MQPYVTNISIMQHAIESSGSPCIASIMLQTKLADYRGIQGQWKPIIELDNTEWNTCNNNVNKQVLILTFPAFLILNQCVLSHSVFMIRHPRNQKRKTWHISWLECQKSYWHWKINTKTIYKWMLHNVVLCFSQYMSC